MPFLSGNLSGRDNSRVEAYDNSFQYPSYRVTYPDISEAIPLDEGYIGFSPLLIG